MQMVLNAEEIKATNELFNFVKNLSEKEKSDFSVFIKGFELGKQIGAKGNKIS